VTLQRHNIKLIRNLAIIAFTVSCANTTFADRNAGRILPPSKITPEQKIVLAEMYEKMATCLRADKTFETCRQEACNCTVLNATGHCPIKP